MNEVRKKTSQQRGMGVGYVTLIMLFAVICLTVLAALSYQAARANDKLNEKSMSFTKEFYAADTMAKERLFSLDEAAYLALQSGFFEDSFGMYCSETEGITARRVPEGTEVSFSEPVGTSLRLSVRITFFSAPAGAERYRIDEWKTTAVSDGGDDTLGVWTGESLT